jgi:cysteine desulfurase/selenocysteine lyase
MPDARQLIYCDNAATSFPKPPGVAEAMSRCLERWAVSPGRSGFDAALAAGQVLDRVRARLDRFFNNPAADPDRAVFTANATDALNLAIQGLVNPGDHVITTVMDHNSVLRPLHELARQQVITCDIVGCGPDGRVDPGQVARLMRPHTRLVVMTHASNVFGGVQPAAAVGRICRERGVLFLLDAAQTAGSWPVDMAALQADLVAFTGHKGLLGPTGIGGLLVGPGVKIRSTRWGGTGVRSAERGHLTEFPYRLEAGTHNLVGIAGLEAGLEYIEQRGLAEIQAHERVLLERFTARVSSLEGVTLHGLGPDPVRRLPADQLAVVSLTVAGQDPATVGMFLDADHDIAVRTGLQCAPLAHQALGTDPAGTVRFSFGPYNTAEQVDRVAGALAQVAAT